MKCHFAVTVPLLFIVPLLALFLATACSKQETPEQLIGTYGEVLKDAARRSLLKMRPSAGFQNASVQMARRSDLGDGGEIKARVATYWITAVTRVNRTTVIDVWITVQPDGIYLTRYSLYSDDHYIPITSPKDARLTEKLVSTSKNSKDF